MPSPSIVLLPCPTAEFLALTVLQIRIVTGGV